MVRYMGTKRHMLTHIFEAIESVGSSGRVVDLFAGMGTVAESLSNVRPVLTNDAFGFCTSLARARFGPTERTLSVEAVRMLVLPEFNLRLGELRSQYVGQLTIEGDALSGSTEDLVRYMSMAGHVGNNRTLQRRSRTTAESSGPDHYELATLYFSAGYLSLAQAMEVDALRYAIDKVADSDHRDWLLSSWLAAVSDVLNAPGHTAQYLKPTSAAAVVRIKRAWRRSVWEHFCRSLPAVNQVGSVSWRSGNASYTGDALNLLTGGDVNGEGLLYADPPYTKDQYSRFYHVYETLFRYDFPDSIGQGRTRSDRFTTGFSVKSTVTFSFHQLCRNAARLQIPLVISYPSNGLLVQAGSDVGSIAKQYFSDYASRSVQVNHSTMGGSSGTSTKEVTEQLHICLP
jgi:adenine-specific DNA-methyltransferase